MFKQLIDTPDGRCLLEVETPRRERRQYPLPANMSIPARLAFLASPRLASVLAHLEKEEAAEDVEGRLVFALQKLALDLMLRHPLPRPADMPSEVAVEPPVPLACVVIRQCSPSIFVFCTRYQGHSVCREEHLDTLQDALAAALLTLPPEAVAVEITYEGIVSGTYARPALERDPEQVALTALHTKKSIEAVRWRP